MRSCTRGGKANNARLIPAGRSLDRTELRTQLAAEVRSRYLGRSERVLYPSAGTWRGEEFRNQLRISPR